MADICQNRWRWIYELSTW